MSVNSSNDPCWFVGLRFAKVQSVCTHNICEGLQFLKESGVVVTSQYMGKSVPVMCGDAMKWLDEYRSSNQDADRTRSDSRSNGDGIPHDVTASLADMQAHILPSLHRLMFKHTHIEGMALKWMDRIHRCLLKHFFQSSDWENIRKYIRSSPEFAEVVIWWNKFTEWSSFMPMSFAGLTAQPTHFFFDLMSLIGPVEEVDLSFRAIVDLTRDAVSSSVQYRGRHVREFVHLIGMDFDGSPQETVEIASLLSEFHRDPSALSLIPRFIQFIASLPISLSPPVSAAETLIRYQISAHMCPRIHVIIGASGLWRANKRQAVQFIHHCLPFVIRHIDTITASIMLTFSAEGHPLLATRNVAQLTHKLIDPTFPWSSGFSTEIPPPLIESNLRLLFHRFIAYYNPRLRMANDKYVYRRRSKFPSNELFESVTRGFGRLMGLMFRYGIEFADILQLPTELLRAVSDEELLTTVGPPKVVLWNNCLKQTFLDQNVYEPIFYIRLGLRDALVPAGIFAIGKDAWVSFQSRTL